MAFKVGDRVEAKIDGWDQYYKGKIAAVNDDGTFKVTFDDGDVVEKVKTEEMKAMAEDYGMEAVMQPTLAPSVFIQQAVIVGFIACFIAFYPLIQINRLNAITEMRS